MKNKYYISGIVVDTEFDFPFCQCYNNLEWQKLEIVSVKLKINISDCYSATDDCLTEENGIYTISFFNKGYYEYNPNEGTIAGFFSKSRDVWLTFFNKPIALIAFLNNGVPIHANAIVDNNGKLLLLLGDKESGKTTQTTFAMRQGFEFFSDDLTIIWHRNDATFVLPGPPFIKLPLDSDFVCNNGILVADYKYFTRVSQPYYVFSSITNVIFLTKYYSGTNFTFTGNDFMHFLSLNSICSEFFFKYRHTYFISLLKYAMSIIQKYSFVNTNQSRCSSFRDIIRIVSI